MVPLRDVWVLFQASIALIVIVFFTYKLERKECLNSLQMADEVVS